MLDRAAIGRAGLRVIVDVMHGPARGYLDRLLAEREPLYREFAAHVVDGRGSPADVAEAIVEELRWSA